jgi:hypothetical protein
MLYESFSWLIYKWNLSGAGSQLIELTGAERQSGRMLIVTVIL